MGETIYMYPLWKRFFIKDYSQNEYENSYWVEVITMHTLAMLENLFTNKYTREAFDNSYWWIILKLHQLWSSSLLKKFPNHHIIIRNDIWFVGIGMNPLHVETVGKLSGKWDILINMRKNILGKSQQYKKNFIIE